MILNTENLTIQTFDDTGNGKGQLAKIFPYNKLEIDSLQKVGAGVFWAVNPQIDPNKRGIENTQELLRVGLDCDVSKEKLNLSTEELGKLKTELFNKLIALPVKPSGIIKTKNGLHPYWEFVEARIIPESKTNEANEFYKELISNFTKVTGITSEADSISRVLRLPNFFHLKNPEKPFLIQEIFSEGVKCSLDEFRKAYTPEISLQSRTSLQLDNSRFQELSGRYGWDVFFGISESEKRSFRGKMHDGRDDLLLSIANSVHNKIVDIEVVSQCIEWINNQAQEPLRDIRKFLKTDWIENHPKITQSLTESIKPKAIHDWIPQRIEERVLEKQASKTGYPELDTLIKGFIPKRLYAVTGKTNAGKTTFACNLAYRVAMQDKKVLYLALEPDTLILDILATIATNKTYTDLVETDYSFIPKNIYVTGSEIKTFEQLKATLNESQSYDLIIIDHIGYFIHNVGEQNLVQQQSQLIQSLARLAKEIGNSILLIAHLNKEGSKKDNPSIYDIAGTASFAQDSQEVLIFNRGIDAFDKFKQSNEALLIVGKTKSGKNGSVKLKFKEGSGLITSEIGEYIQSKNPTVKPNLSDIAHTEPEEETEFSF